MRITLRYEKQWHSASWTGGWVWARWPKNKDLPVLLFLPHKTLQDLVSCTKSPFSRSHRRYERIFLIHFVKRLIKHTHSFQSLTSNLPVHHLLRIIGQQGQQKWSYPFRIQSFVFKKTLKRWFVSHFLNSIVRLI